MVQLGVIEREINNSECKEEEYAVIQVEEETEAREGVTKQRASNGNA